MIGDGDCGEIGGMKIGRGNRILRENLPQRHFVHHKSHMTRPGFESGPPLWEASDEPLELWRGPDITCSSVSYTVQLTYLHISFNICVIHIASQHAYYCTKTLNGNHRRLNKKNCEIVTKN
jgi:hypothetical protein